MADSPSPDPSQDQSTPAPEVLKPRSPDAAPDATGGGEDKTPAKPITRGNYQPSHRATFIGLAVVVAILAVNAIAIAFVLKSGDKSDAKKDEVSITLNKNALDQLGVNKSTVGDLGIQLTVNPDAKFNGKLTVGGDASIAGQLKLNNKLFAANASLTQLESGTAALNTLNVNGAATLSTLNLRSDLLINGRSTLQGPVTLNQLLTVNAGLNVKGNVAVGGILSVNTFHASTLVVDNGITFSGHVVTKGSRPSVSKGSATGSNGSVSISGNDASGTVAVNIGVGASGGTLASVTFARAYGSTPHVVITPVGGSVGSFFINRSASGFSIHVAGGLSPGGYAFDYIVQQ
jgi:hypothetical protein